MNISDLTENDIGRNVIYTPHHSTPEDPCTEEGVLSSWNSSVIFVRYGRGSTAAGTDPAQLHFSNPYGPRIRP
jgi:hypothetical protein